MQAVPTSVMIIVIAIFTVLLAAETGRAARIAAVQPIASCWEQRALTVRVLPLDRAVTLQLAESSGEFRRIDLTSTDEVAIAKRSCFYQGFETHAGGLAVMKVIDGLISGTFTIDNQLYEVQQQPADSGELRADRLLLTSGPRSCALRKKKLTDSRTPSSYKAANNNFTARSRRSVKLDINKDASSAGSLYISLFLVGDEYFYANQSSDATVATNRLWEIGNYVNALYKQLGIHVLIAGVRVLTSAAYTLSSATDPAGANSTEMLEKFMLYRMQALGTQEHMVAHLVSGLRMTGSDVGLAHQGKLCQFAFSGGVNSDRDPNAVGVSVTVAHELGHNLGFNHVEDEPGCTCPDSHGCIMTAVATEVNPFQFASCSFARLAEYAVPAGLGYCMSRPPSASLVASARSLCGNRIVDAGEQCDCGLPQWCNNTCCNPSTCQFASGAACASGQCCDTSSCSIKAAGTLCRSAKGTCDLDEFCNGASEWCPSDDHKIDGTSCLAGKAYCHSGECNDRDSRCSALFVGSFTAAASSNDVGNTVGKDIGYCSYDSFSLEPLNYTYTQCSSANQRCGALYCTDGSLSAYPNPKWKFLDPADIHLADLSVGGVSVRGALARLNLNYSGFRDPGLVPNGAECGANMMCENSACIAVSTKTSGCPNCNGNGVCTQQNLCFCNDGFAPPACNTPGLGGSSANTKTAASATTTAAATTGSTQPPGSSGTVLLVAPALRAVSLAAVSLAAAAAGRI